MPLGLQGSGFGDDSGLNVAAANRQFLNTNNSASNENSRSVVKRKYVKRAKPKNDVGSQDSGGKDKRQGRWTREEKQKFIDGKCSFISFNSPSIFVHYNRMPIFKI